MNSERFNNRAALAQYSHRPLSAEEQELWKNCVDSIFYKIALPFAVFTTCFVSLINKHYGLPPPTFYKRSIHFGVSFFMSYFIGVPMCATSVHKKYIENLEKEERLKNESPINPQQTESTPEDDSGLSMKYDDSYSSFSNLNLDYTPSENLTFEEPNAEKLEKEIKPRMKLDVTYDDLRRQNRQSFTYSPPQPVYDRQPYQYSSHGQPSQSEAIPRKPKNKYGDDME